jgi:aminodeoxychorismate synthase component I
MASATSQIHLRLDGSAGWATDCPRPSLIVRCDAATHLTTMQDAGGKRVQSWTDPLEALAWMARYIRDRPSARWIGYLSYDLGRLFEKVRMGPPDDLGLPLLAFGLQEEPSPGGDVLKGIPRPIASDLRSTFTRASYMDAVSKAIEYIRAGDIFQVNLSQRFTARTSEAPASIYRSMIERSPAPYGAFLDFGDHALICNSPELFLRVTPDRKVITRPIKGTRPRQPGMDIALRDSIKDQAELNMIVDLERNDLGRVCEIGSVRVSDPRTLEAPPTVHHDVATIEGALRNEVTFVDLLRAVFPGGSITGAPKIRAMQIIDELEPVRRGPYCGAIGYLASDGSMEFNIAIRTMIARNGLVHIPVGGGIVADSDPASEYDETLVKARAMFAAVGVEEGVVGRLCR